MAGVNKVILIGNLGSDPETRTTPSGQMVANLSLATSEVWTDREGKRQERTEWHRVVLWGKLAELAQRWLQKGSQVYIEGKLTTRSWEDQQTGQKRYTEVVGQQMTFLGKSTGEQRPSAPPPQAPAPADGRTSPVSGEPGYFDSDVPF